MNVNTNQYHLHLRSRYPAKCRFPGKGALAEHFGFSSSSCSFAALAASRIVLVKGAQSTNAITFLIATMKLVPVAIALLVLRAWHLRRG